jgi:hypothetical protein
LFVPDTLYTRVVLFEGESTSGDIAFGLFCTVALKYDPVAFRSVQNVPATVGTGKGSKIFENPEFTR